MITSLAQDERIEFSQRLVAAVVAAGHDPSATIVTREFNVRSERVTVTKHAVRRWLKGGSFPTQAKMTILARWLGVTQEWLRFGTGSRLSIGTHVESFPASGDIDSILEDYRRLSDHSKLIFNQTLNTMLKLQAAASKNR